MRNEGIKTAEFHWRHKLILPTAREVAGASRAAVGSSPWEWAFLVVTVGLLGYGVYLAWDAWGRLLAALVNPGSPDFIIISLAIQVVAPLLAPLAYLAVWLSSHREEPWFLGVRALCVLGLLTTAIEVCAHALR
ncbi:MAG TPA: hypothetical protein VG860_02105 [Terriglobia bacterium]|nr:hypothetical protein [Terriglobia bacterium]